MGDEGREAVGPVLAALDALADHAQVDWTRLAAAAGGDDDVRCTLDVLHDIEGIVRAHAPMQSPMAAPTLSLPFRWGPLDVRAHLARGAHGDVYRARDLRLDRDVALKLVRHDADDAHQESTPVAITEGRLLARVRHPNVVAVYGADRIDGQAGIWMEFVEGATLHECLVADGPFAPTAVVEIGRAICAGLAAVHAAGLVHRDIKAQNVMRESTGRTILMDLGAGEDGADPTHRLEGTPLYLAPEVLEGGRATVASDLYAVGVLLHLLATGSYAIFGETLDQLRTHHRKPHRRAVLRERMPAGLADIIERATALTPAGRYASATAMQQALADLVQPTSGRRPPAQLSLCTGLALAIAWALTLTAGERGGTPSALLAGPAAEGKVVALPTYHLGPLSADGRFVPYIDELGNAHRYEIATGDARTLLRASGVPGRATSVLLSQDSSHIAYAWQRSDGRWELRKSRAGGATRVVMPPQGTSVPAPLDWSSDGRMLLCTLRERGGAIGVVLVRDEFGTPPRELLAVRSGGDVSGVLSKDGRLAAIAIHAGKADDALHLVDIAARTARRLHNGPAALPRFAADDQHLFFIRREQVGDELWSVPLQDGVPTGAPVRTAAALGGVIDIRVSADGVLHRVSSVASAEVYTAPFDALGSAPPGRPEPIDPAEVGNHVGPSWSPDGRSLAYFTIRPTLPGLTPERTLTLRDMTTGQVRPLSVPLVFVGGYTPRWSADGRYVAVWGRDGVHAGAWGYFRVDVTSGDTTLLVRLGINAPALAQFSPDGRAFLYTDPRRGIVSRELTSGREHVVVAVHVQGRPTRFSVSPDGASLAFVRVAGPDDALTTTLEVQRRGHAPAVKARAAAPDWLTLHAWTPDGTHVLYANGRGDGPGRLWRVGADSGAPVDLRFRTLDAANAISLHPDGRRIAYAERVLTPQLLRSRLPVP